MSLDGRFLLLLACFLVSGMAALAYETAWTQQFALVFGASELAVVAVLAAYMAGLTLGAAAGARALHRVRRPVLVYALLELGIGASALLVPVALRLAQRLQVLLLGGAELLPEEGSLATILFHLVSSFAILLVPTGFMGATLPLLARTAVRREEQIGGRVGTLYTANTLGAALGTLGTAFLLLPRFGLGRTVLFAAAANLAAFLLALPLVRGVAPPLPAAPRDRPRRRASFILPLVLISSAASFTYEILWTRLLTFVLGASVYAFATMLATFLLGIALGSGLAARLARAPEVARLGFAVAQLGIAALSLLAFQLVDRLPELAGALSRADAGFLLAGTSLCALTLLPGAICVGATFPFAVRLLAGGAAEAGTAAARVYAWSTIGAVLGSILGGLVVLPALRFEGTLVAASACGLLLAAAAALLAPPRLWRVAAAAGVGLLGLALWQPATPWRLLRHSPLPGEFAGEVVYYSVGRGATVLLHDMGWEWKLTSNGLPESAIQGPGARSGRYGVAHWLPLLALGARPSTRSLLVVGLGAGLTLEEVPPSVREIEVVELEPEVVNANRALAGRRRKDPLADPRVHLSLNDARSALLLTRHRFDAIVSQPSHPWTAGASHLFTREFFGLVRDRLTDEGVFVQWMGTDFVDEPLLRTLLATLAAVFPHVEVYDPYPGMSLLFLASQRPLAVVATSAQAIAAAPGAWARVGVFGPEDLLVARVQDGEGVARLAAGAPLNTDPWNLLQTRSPRLERPLDAAGSDRVFARFDPLPREAEGESGLYLVRRLLQKRTLPRARRVALAMPAGVPRRVTLALLDVASGQRARGAAALRAAFAEAPDAPVARHALLALEGEALLRDGGDPQGLLPRLEGDALATALVAGWRLSRAGRIAEAAALDAELARADAHHALFEPALRLRVGWRAASGNPARAREGLELLDPFLATASSPTNVLLRARLALAAQEPAAVLASLDEIARGARRRSGVGQAGREALELLQALPASWRDDPRALRIAEQLRARAPTGHRGAAE